VPASISSAASAADRNAGRVKSRRSLRNISRKRSGCVRATEVSYYIGRETVIPTEHIPGMWVWREALFAFMQRNAERSAAYFWIPAAQVVEIGIEIEI
jgi:K+ transporter